MTLAQSNTKPRRIAPLGVSELFVWIGWTSAAVWLLSRSIQSLGLVPTKGFLPFLWTHAGVVVICAIILRQSRIQSFRRAALLATAALVCPWCVSKFLWLVLSFALVVQVLPLEENKTLVVAMGWDPVEPVQTLYYNVRLDGHFVREWQYFDGVVNRMPYRPYTIAKITADRATLLNKQNGVEPISVLLRPDHR